MPETPGMLDGFTVSALVRGLVILLAAIGGALLVHQVGFRIARRIVDRVGGVAARSLVTRASRPLAVILPTVAVQLVLPLLPLPGGLGRFAPQAVSIVLIMGVTWLMTRLTYVASDVVEARYPTNVADNHRARRINTMVRIMRQTASVILIVAGAAVALMTIPQVSQLGASVLASAGIAGLAIGMAARPALSNLIAGVQIALTEPIALDDVVFVQGEFGNIEEITTTYVVVRVWDQRRIIVPLSHFIEQPFQNLTRVSADLMGTVTVTADFNTPIDAVRAELGRILQASALWDKRVGSLQVSDATGGRIELRILVSAANASALWDLRCEVREKIVQFLQHPPAHAAQRPSAEAAHPPPTQPAAKPAGQEPDKGAQSEAA